MHCRQLLEVIRSISDMQSLPAHDTLGVAKRLKWAQHN